MESATNLAALIVAERDRAWRMALSISGDPEMAADAVQEACASILSSKAAAPDDSPCAWFLKAVANTARTMQRKAGIRREREGRWAVETGCAGPGRSPAVEAAGRELGRKVGRALAALDEKFRLPIQLHYQEGLSHAEVAAVLSVPKGTVAVHIQRGLKRLREQLSREGVTAAPAALIGGLAAVELPSVPTGLVAALDEMIASNGAIAGMASSSAGAAAGAAAKGGLAMKAILAVALAGTVAAGAAGLSAFGFRPSEPRETGGAPAAAAPAVGSNPVTGRQEREEVFEFAEKPKVAKQGDKLVITFASKGKCDATVAIVDGQGKIVRHLASGVLGANAPWPFQQNLLAQKVEWDGKDDKGKPAPAGSKVRVSLGLKPALDKDLFQFNEQARVSGMAVDAQGFLHLVSFGPMIQVFARDGSYQRTLYPRPARANGGIKLKVVEYMEPDCHAQFMIPRQSPQITRDGRLLWVTGGAMGSNKGSPGAKGKIKHRRLFVTDTRSGDLLRIENVCESSHAPSARGGPQGTMGGGGGVEMGLSPDDKWLYFGTAHHPGMTLISRLTAPYLLISEGGDRFNPHVHHHAVSRTSVENPGLTEPVLGDVKTPGTDNAHFNWPRGVAFDAKGNLYVCDHFNDRVQVFGPAPEHKYLKTIPIERPDQIAVHPKTGAIYVLCTKIDGVDPDPRSDCMRGGTTRVVKMGSLEDPSVMAEIAGRILGPRGMRGSRDDPKSFDGYVATGFALDSASTPPAVWMDSMSHGVVRFDDMGKEFKRGPVVSLATMGAPPPEIDGKRLQCGISNTSMYVTADPYREEIYVREGNGNYGSTIVRMNGRTGEAIERLGGFIWDSYMGPDGLLYGRSVKWSTPHWLWRYDPDARKFLPFPETDVRLAPLPPDAGNAPLCPVFEQGAGKYQYTIGGVAPNGDLYVPHSPTASVQEILKKKGVDMPADNNGQLKLLAVLSSTGKLKTLHAFDSFLQLHGLPCYRIGPSGALYMSHHCKPAGQEHPEGFDPQVHKGSIHWGSIVKFDSRLDTFPIVAKFSQDRGALGGARTHTSKRGGEMRIGNMAWTYGGIGLLAQEGCRCGRTSFDVDRFERVFVPKHTTHSVDILDANGNVIVRAGERGNIDNRGRESLVRDPKTGILRQREPNDPQNIESPFAEPSLTFITPQHLGVTDEALYVMDPEAKRLRRVKLCYAAEETVPAP